MTRRKRFISAAAVVLLLGIAAILVQTLTAAGAPDSHKRAKETVNHRPVLVLAGIDSLTNGPIHLQTKSRYLDDFIPRMHQIFGNGGPGYVPFDSLYFNQEKGEFHYSFDVHEINDLVPGQYPSQYSLDLKGIYTNRGFMRWMSVNMPSSWQWKYGKIFYLTQPDGGSFQVGYSSGKTEMTVNTNASTRHLGVAILPEHKPGESLRFTHINGKVIIFGGLFLNDDGVAVSRIGQAGDRLAWHAGIRNDMMVQWLGELRPSLLIFNGGMNDRGALTQQGYQIALKNYLQPFSDAGTQMLLVAPNAILGNNQILHEYQSVLSSYATKHQAGLIDNKDVLGKTYLSAVSHGYMGDHIHPNDKGSELISKHIFHYLISNGDFESFFPKR